MNATQTTLYSWSDSHTGKGIDILRLHTGEYQIRETWPTPGAPTPELFPGTDAGLTEARAIARCRAQLIRMI